MQPIVDPASPALDDFRHLTDAAARRAIEAPTNASSGAPEGIFIAEGLNAMEQLLHSGLAVRTVLLTPRRFRSHGDRFIAAGMRVHVVEREVLRSVTGFDVHRGVLASVARPAPTDHAELIASCRRAVVSEAVSDNENVGAVFRTAAAFGLDAVLLDPASGDPFYRRAVRVSSGWSVRIPSARIDHVPSTVAELRNAGVTTVALDPRSGVAADAPGASSAFSGRFALVIGAEGTGLTSDTISACDLRVSVPMADEVDSLNVATALAVVAAFAGSVRGWT